MKSGERCPSKDRIFIPYFLFDGAKYQPMASQMLGKRSPLSYMPNAKKLTSWELSNKKHLSQKDT
jgi:hypothetical protein